MTIGLDLNQVAQQQGIVAALFVIEVIRDYRHTVWMEKKICTLTSCLMDMCHKSQAFDESMIKPKCP